MPRTSLFSKRVLITGAGSGIAGTSSPAHRSQWPQGPGSSSPK